MTSTKKNNEKLSTPLLVGNKPDAKFWSCDDSCEEYSCTDMNDAIEEYLDNFLAPNMTVEEVISALPKHITAYGFYPEEIPNTVIGCADALTPLLESWDEEYGNPNEATKPTEKMKEAHKAFIDVVKSEYRVWSCECVREEEINVLDWVAEYRKDWLEDTNNEGATDVNIAMGKLLGRVMHLEQELKELREELRDERCKADD